MRRRLIDQLLDLFRPTSTRRRTRPKTSSERRKPPVRDDGTQVVIEYTPSLDGEPDPGEVVWTWVSYEDDPSQGKDRPVVVIGHRGRYLAAVALTSKRHDNELQIPVGTGSWDREGRPSYAKVERVLDVDPKQVRREGAVLSRGHFDDVVAGVREAQQS
ncbi:MAG: type II toxin-antitoxin system PemK/MazF family toxin [Actinobacteria bacterium]|nr:type II toxin-antitoxin system PemK/MazF family toxin [Actinomycetota bacterium]